MSADSSTRADLVSRCARITNSGLIVATRWCPPSSTKRSMSWRASGMSRQSTLVPRTRVCFKRQIRRRLSRETDGAAGVSTSTFVTVTAGMEVPRPTTKSYSDSPPPTRTRVHRYLSSRLCVIETCSVTAVVVPGGLHGEHRLGAELARRVCKVKDRMPHELFEPLLRLDKLVHRASVRHAGEVGVMHGVRRDLYAAAVHLDHLGTRDVGSLVDEAADDVGDRREPIRLEDWIGRRVEVVVAVVQGDHHRLRRQRLDAREVGAHLVEVDRMIAMHGKPVHLLTEDFRRHRQPVAEEVEARRRRRTDVVIHKDG